MVDNHGRPLRLDNADERVSRERVNEKLSENREREMDSVGDVGDYPLQILLHRVPPVTRTIEEDGWRAASALTPRTDRIDDEGQYVRV